MNKMVGILLYLNYNFLIFKKKHAVRRAGVLLRIAHQYLTVIIERKNKHHDLWLTLPSISNSKLPH